MHIRHCMSTYLAAYPNLKLSAAIFCAAICRGICMYATSRPATTPHLRRKDNKARQYEKEKNHMKLKKNIKKT